MNKAGHALGDLTGEVIQAEIHIFKLRAVMKQACDGASEIVAGDVEGGEFVTGSREAHVNSPLEPII